MKVLFYSSLFTLVLAFTTSTTEAKVFNLTNVNASSYLKAIGGTSNIHNDAFIHGGGGYDQVTVKDGAIYSFGGEFGFSFEAGSTTTRLGIELARPQKLSDYEVKDANGAILYTLESEIVAFSPSVTFEWALAKAGTSKTYVFTGGGYSYVTLVNNYNMTSAGTTAFSKASFIEDAKTQAIFGTLGLGYEMLLVDNVTISMEFGYRHLEARRFLMRGTSDAISKNYQADDVLKNTDGSDRRLILSHPFVGVLFKFYL
ncbi:MAG: hypothetical protein SGJ18_11020 [Pseudomonadota bacterium]|nr:hypothetical protein [Pseudomonadota bacterium]